MTEADFDYLRRFLKARSGLDLGPSKRYLAETRLLPICRERGYGSPAVLLRELRREPEGDLARVVVDAMATNETSFFRDRAPFDALRETVLPGLLEARGGSRRLRVWSAACSTGQEPYSLAMLLDDMAPALAGWQVSILATDISGAAVERAGAGLYSQLEVQRGLPIGYLLRHFTQEAGGWRISAALRAAVEFRRVNLLDDLRRLGRFDLVLCRNLMIYLDGPTKADVMARLTAALAPGGRLCLGAAESGLGHERLLVPDPAARGFFVPAQPSGIGRQTRPALLRAVG